MRTLILTIGITLLSVTSNAQDLVKMNVDDTFPNREWYAIYGDDFKDMIFYTSDDKNVNEVLRDILFENNIVFTNTIINETYEGGIIHKKWSGYISEDKKIIINYVKNKSNSDISIQYKKM